MIGSMFRYEIEEQNHAGKTNIASVGCKTLQPPDMLRTKTDFIISGRTVFEGRKIPLGLSPECYCRDGQLRSLRSLDPWRKPSRKRDDGALADLPPASRNEGRRRCRRERQYYLPVPTRYLPANLPTLTPSARYKLGTYVPINPTLTPTLQ